MPSRALAAAALTGLTLLLAAPAGAESPNVNTAPTITGSAVVGSQLTAHNGTWLYLDGTACGPECQMTYQWQRCAAGCTDVEGATPSRFYTVQAADAGHTLRVVETMTKHDCSANPETGGCAWVSRTAVSAHTAVVPGSAPTPPTGPAPPSGPKPLVPLAPVVSAAPTVVGLAMVDETLKATVGTWSGAQPLTVGLQWLRCDANGERCETLGLTGETYTVIQHDIGKTLRVRVTASNPAGAREALSDASAPVSELKPTEARPSLPAQRVVAPHKLVAAATVRPATLVRRGAVAVRVQVTDTRGFRISGALVTGAALPGAALLAPAEATSAEDGTALLTFAPGPKLSLKKRSTITLVLTARRPGDRLTSPRAAIVRVKVAVVPAKRVRR